MKFAMLKSITGTVFVVGALTMGPSATPGKCEGEQCPDVSTDISYEVVLRDFAPEQSSYSTSPLAPPYAPQPQRPIDNFSGIFVTPGAASAQYQGELEGLRQTDHDRYMEYTALLTAAAAVANEGFAMGNAAASTLLQTYVTASSNWTMWSIEMTLADLALARSDLAVVSGALEAAGNRLTAITSEIGGWLNKATTPHLYRQLMESYTALIQAQSNVNMVTGNLTVIEARIAQANALADAAGELAEGAYARAKVLGRLASVARFLNQIGGIQLLASLGSGAYEAWESAAVGDLTTNDGIALGSLAANWNDWGTNRTVDWIVRQVENDCVSALMATGRQSTTDGALSECREMIRNLDWTKVAQDLAANIDLQCTDPDACTAGELALTVRSMVGKMRFEPLPGPVKLLRYSLVIEIHAELPCSDTPNTSGGTGGTGGNQGGGSDDVDGDGLLSEQEDDASWFHRYFISPWLIYPMEGAQPAVGHEEDESEHETLYVPQAMDPNTAGRVLVNTVSDAEGTPAWYFWR